MDTVVSELDKLVHDEDFKMVTNKCNQVKYFISKVNELVDLIAYIFKFNWIHPMNKSKNRLMDFKIIREII